MAARHELVWPWIAVAVLGLGGALAVANVLWQGAHPPVARPGAAPAGAASPASGAAPHGMGEGPLRALTEQLQARLRRNPADADGWAMLARTHAVGGQPERAVPAFRQAVALRPDDAVLLADFADALATTQGLSLAGEPGALVQRALALAPDHPKVLSLAGREAFDRSDWKTALRHWERLIAVVGDNSVFVRQVRSQVDEARRHADPRSR